MYALSTLSHGRDTILPFPEVSVHNWTSVTKALGMMYLRAFLHMTAGPEWFIDYDPFGVTTVMAILAPRLHSG